MAETPENEPDAVTSEEQAELLRLDALILAGRGRPFRSAGLKDLRALMYLAIVLLMVAVGAYLLLPAPDRRVVSLMASIAGGVLSGWGLLRGIYTAQGGGIAGIGWVYAVFFAVMGAVFGVLCAGLVGWLDGK